MYPVLTEYVLSRSGELSSRVADGELSTARSILAAYAQGRLPYEQAQSEYQKIRLTSQPVDLLHAILSVADEPLPAPAVVAREPFGHAEHAKMRSWTNAEDLRLLSGILRFGIEDWSRIAAFVGSGRSKSQCHQRWTRGLDPRIIKATWTPQQDELLLMLVALYGQKGWTRISIGLGNRCDVQCRYRYNVLKKDSDFDDRMRAARQKVMANPAIIGRPLRPFRTPQRKRVRASFPVREGLSIPLSVACTGDGDDENDAVFGGAQAEEMGEMFECRQRHTGAFEESTSSDFDESE